LKCGRIFGDKFIAYLKLCVLVRNCEKQSLLQAVKMQQKLDGWAYFLGPVFMSAVWAWTIVQWKLLQHLRTHTCRPLKQLKH